MPPFLPRKRTPPPASPLQSTPRKRTKLSDILDVDPGQSFDLQAAKRFTLGDDESESALSDIDSDEFEDVPQDGEASRNGKHEEQGDHDEEIDWEDAMVEHASVNLKKHVPMTEGNLELNLSRVGDEGGQYGFVKAATNTKKGPTKIEREIRLQTHCMHVQFLLYHNAIRNRWICDKEVQDTLVQQLPSGITKEIQRWRVASGLELMQGTASRTTPSTPKSNKKGRRGAAEDERSQRDWGTPSNRLEKGKPDLSRGDPVISLLKVLAAYWKKRFTITAPGLRKIGYASAAGRQRQIRSFKNDEHDPEKHGERIQSLSEFRKLAQKCEGSRDVAAQLFTALLRGIGIDSRLVASLQPSGFGWTKNEQAEIKIPGKIAGQENNESSSDTSDDEAQTAQTGQNTTRNSKSRQEARAGRKTPGNKGKGNRNDPVDLDTSSANESILSESDDASTVDITLSAVPRKPNEYDRDLPFPIYWTEVVSPINSVIVPVSPLVLSNAVASTPEILSTFEPRGAKAEKAKQVMAYVVAYSSDGSAKDVTTRYLKRRMWPGKTKGVRIPVEKIPIYNKRGKILRRGEYDWFKSAMSGYVRTDTMRTAVDDVEESTDLVPQQAGRKEKQQEGDTLQSLKSSAEFVLERFLRREEALKASAKPVRTFATGKGDKLKEENVYYRSDVERCLSAESWHKEGRQIREGEVPMKLVPIRAVTLTRKREVEEMQRQTGEKPTQGLYCRDQTEYIIPPPIKDGIIPRNGYGNIDCFVPSMVPRGAVHIPMRGTVRICKKLEIDYAEAVTGFEFGKKMAIPVVEGVVVAEEHEQAVRAGWEEYAEQQRVKEEGKLEKAVLNLWRRMLMGLRIRERVSDTYGEDGNASGEMFGLGNNSGQTHELLAPEDGVGEQGSASVGIHDGGGFLLPHEEGEDDPTTGSGELIVEHHGFVLQPKYQEAEHYPTPISITSTDAKASRGIWKSALETNGSSELSEAKSINDELDNQDSKVRRKRAKPGNDLAIDSPKKATTIVVEIPKKNPRPTKHQIRAPPTVTSEEEEGASPSPEGPGSDDSEYGTQTPQSPQPAKRKRSSARSKRLLSSGPAASPKRTRQPGRASRKAALRSPYFHPDPDRVGSSDG
jgi:xeroderma pigmentosum group C-complementing protein